MEDFNVNPPLIYVDLVLQMKDCVLNMRVVLMAKSVARIPMALEFFAVSMKIAYVRNHFLLGREIVSVLRGERGLEKRRVRVVKR